MQLQLGLVPRVGLWFQRDKTYFFLVLPGNIHPYPEGDLGPSPRDYPQGETAVVTSFLIAARAISHSHKEVRLVICRHHHDKILYT